MKSSFAEFIGTFCLVFAGTGAIVIESVAGGTIPPVGVALTFGLIVLAMIYTVGDVLRADLLFARRGGSSGGQQIRRHHSMPLDLHRPLLETMVIAQ